METKKTTITISVSKEAVKNDDFMNFVQDIIPVITTWGNEGKVEPVSEFQQEGETVDD